MADLAMKKTTRATRAKGTQSSPEALLDALHSLMIERRGLDVAIADISERSGLNTGLVRYYFKSKNGMLVALLDRIVNLPVRNLRALIDAPITPWEKLKRHLSGLINTHYRYPYMNELVAYLINGTDEEIAKHVYTSSVEPLLIAQRAIIQQGVESGEFRDVDPTFSYFTLTGACDYMFTASYVHRLGLHASEVSDEMRQRYTEHVLNFVRAGLQADVAG